MGNPVTTTLEKPVYDGWKASGLKLNHLVGLGLQASRNNPQQIQRIREVEEGNEKLQRKITVLMNRINELEKQ